MTLRIDRFSISASMAEITMEPIKKTPSVAKDANTMLFKQINHSFFLFYIKSPYLFEVYFIVSRSFYCAHQQEKYFKIFA